VKPLTIHSDAEAELRSAATYYESQRDGLGREFLREFDVAAAWIRQSVDAHPGTIERQTRKRRLARFPYTIYYAELDDMIWIAAVAHQKRRPGYWSKRKP
jgi:plasmid stabilization system protein ParE